MFIKELEKKYKKKKEERKKEYFWSLKLIGIRYDNNKKKSYFTLVL
jgi:hypothetical protein